MPANNAASKSKPRGRPKGCITKFPGSCLFAAEHNLSRSHVNRVLNGERVSAKLVNQFAAWLSSRGLPWPSAAKIKPDTV